MMEKHFFINKKSTRTTSRWIAYLVIVLMLTVSGMSVWIVQANPGTVENFAGLNSKNYEISEFASRFEDQEHLRVIVQLKIPDRVTNSKNQQSEIQKAQRDLINGLNQRSTRLVHEYKFIPFVAMEVDQAGFEALHNSPMVAGIEEDQFMKLLLLESIPIINAEDVWAAGFTGEGQVIAILDTGVDKNHPDLLGKVVSEACYSTTSVVTNPPTTSLCPDNLAASTAVDSALPYASNCPAGECDHGTHVAGIVAANGLTYKGVAKDANLIAIQVFSRVNNSTIGSWSSDQIKGLDRVYELKDSFNIAAVNLSLGGSSPYTTICDNLSSNLAYKAAVDQLRSAGIVTIAASGNNGSSVAISSPACISTVVSVGATTDADAVASFTNSTSFLDLLAPGSNIISPIPYGDYESMYGTSMAAPHVAGAWALVKSVYPEMDIDTILWGFKVSGKPITDQRNGTIKPRIDVLKTINFLENIQQVYLPLITR
ncbi:MAG: S8 family serine peptidase [Anaerolineaceae bacterium]|nr:S8 family serine peptidase [Anaerolineaceae bacterium]